MKVIVYDDVLKFIINCLLKGKYEQYTACDDEVFKIEKVNKKMNQFLNSYGSKIYDELLNDLNRNEYFLNRIKEIPMAAAHEGRYRFIIISNKELPSDLRKNKIKNILKN